MQIFVSSINNFFSFFHILPSLSLSLFENKTIHRDQTPFHPFLVDIPIYPNVSNVENFIAETN